MEDRFEIRKHEDILDMIDTELNNGGIVELKLEKRTIPTLVAIKRTKRIPPNTHK